MRVFKSIFFYFFYPFLPFSNFHKLLASTRLTSYMLCYKYILHTMYFIQTGKLKFNEMGLQKTNLCFTIFLTDQPHCFHQKKKWKMENQYTFISSHENWQKRNSQSHLVNNFIIRESRKRKKSIRTFAMRGFATSIFFVPLGCGRKICTLSFY